MKKNWMNDVPRPDVMYHGQPFWRVGDTDYVTKDGRKIMMEVWATFCAECGVSCHVYAMRDDDRGFHPTRRCEEHKGMNKGKRI